MDVYIISLYLVKMEIAPICTNVRSSLNSMASNITCERLFKIKLFFTISNVYYIMHGIHSFALFMCNISIDYFATNHSGLLAYIGYITKGLYLEGNTIGFNQNMYHV